MLMRNTARRTQHPIRYSKRIQGKKIAVNNHGYMEWKSFSAFFHFLWLSLGVFTYFRGNQRAVNMHLCDIHTHTAVHIAAMDFLIVVGDCTCQNSNNSFPPFLLLALRNCVHVHCSTSTSCSLSSSPSHYITSSWSCAKIFVFFCNIIICGSNVLAGAERTKPVFRLPKQICSYRFCFREQFCGCGCNGMDENVNWPRIHI